jgi:pyridoxal phosphate enzyme (YggS family)
MPPGADIASNLDAVRRRVATAATRAGRPPDHITLLAVSKTFGPDDVRQAAAAGQRHFGENRVQEAEPKIAALAAKALERADESRPTWHLIGHLQTNKARRAAALFDWVQSVDSARVADALDRHAAELGKRLQVLVEVNTSGEKAKTGIPPAGAGELVAHVARCSRLDLRGFMTLGPADAGPEGSRAAFRLLATLREDVLRAQPSLQLEELSMGMSDDFEIAVEEGATMVRLGSALFGARPVIAR